MSTESKSINDLIVEYMNELQELVRKDVEWIERQSDLQEYSIHVTNLESNLQRLTDRLLAFRERVVNQIASKCGRGGSDIYGRESSNIRTRRFFSKLAEFFCHKFDG